MNEQQELFPYDIYDYGEFFLQRQQNVAVACVGEWPKVLGDYLRKYAAEFCCPATDLDLRIFDRVYASATRLREQGYMIVYPKGNPPVITLASPQRRIIEPRERKVAPEAYRRVVCEL